MSREFQRIESAFHAVLVRCESDTAANALNEVCGSDQRLRSSVEALLDSYHASDSFFERPAIDHVKDEIRELAATDGETERLGNPQIESPTFTHVRKLAAGEAAWATGFSSPSGGPTIEVPKSLLPHRKLGDYEVLDLIGSGGMGLVVKAHDTRLDREVAIKVMKPALASDSESQRRFVQEAQAAAKVIHPNVVTIHAVHEFGNLSCLVMEYVYGKTLNQRIQQGPLSLREIVAISHQLALGLAAAHKRCIVHRDVKPANILLLDDELRVKITDFGLARVMTSASQTQSGVVTGTPRYMSPEQAEGQVVDHRSDLFSLGSVMYELCTGRSPFQADTVMGIMYRVAHITHRPINQNAADPVPEWLTKIIDRLLEKRPEDRIQSAAELATLLEAGPTVPSHVTPVKSQESVNRAPAAHLRKTILRNSIVLIPAVLLVSIICLIAVRTLERGGPGVIAREAVQSDKDEFSQAASTIPVAQASGRTADHVAASSSRSTSKLAHAEIPLNWQAPEEVTRINSPGYESGPFISADGLTLLFHGFRNRAELQPPVQLWQAQRRAVDETFGEPVRLDDLVNSASFVSADPSMTADGLLLVFSSDRPGGSGHYDVWMSSRPSAVAAWEPPINLNTTVNTEFSEWEPEISGDGLSVYFHTDRRGGFGGTDMWVARRSSRNDAFQPAENLGTGVNSAANEGGVSLSRDGNTLLFHRVEADASISLWRACRDSSNKPFGRCQSLQINELGNRQATALSVAKDGSVLFYSALGPDGRNVDIWQSRGESPTE